MDKNYSNVWVLQGGWRVWVREGYPVERK